jgi:diguanylate cyclase (GGDEF)-like protein
VVFLGLSRFKNISDSLGHDAGDQVLQEVSARPATVVRNGETAARLFDEEFAFGYQFYTASRPRLTVR